MILCSMHHLLRTTGAKLQIGSGRVTLVRHRHLASAHDPPDPLRQGQLGKLIFVQILSPELASQA